GGANKTSVGLTHQVGERNTAILVLFGDREREAKVGANELRAGSVALGIRGGSAHLASELFLLVCLEHRLTPELFYIEVQEVAVVRGRVHLLNPPRRQRAPNLKSYCSTTLCFAGSPAWATFYPQNPGFPAPAVTLALVQPLALCPPWN